MSRRLFPVSSLTTKVIIGSDHAVGQFIQIADKRYAESGKDDQGEGYLLDWDQLFGFNINLIGATLDDLKSADEMWDKIGPKVEAFIQSLNN